MKRYQVYLNPDSVATIDQYEQETNLSRSGVIRMVVDAVAVNLQKTRITKRTGTKTGSLDSIIGIIDPNGKKTTYSSAHVDDMYR
jgi:hypothetical protein